MCHTHARPCLSTGWALDRRFDLTFGTAAVLAQGGGGATRVGAFASWVLGGVRGCQAVRRLSGICIPSAALPRQWCHKIIAEMFAQIMDTAQAQHFLWHCFFVDPIVCLSEAFSVAKNTQIHCLQSPAGCLCWGLMLQLFGAGFVAGPVWVQRVKPSSDCPMRTLILNLPVSPFT